MNVESGGGGGRGPLSPPPLPLDQRLVSPIRKVCVQVERNLLVHMNKMQNEMQHQYTREREERKWKNER